MEQTTEQTKDKKETSGKKEMFITFCGGTETVTGANFLIEADGKKILIDCGLTQGTKMAEDVNWEPFTYNPAEIDLLFVTHGHVDHIGRVPKLIYDGFKGDIYSTPPTKDIAELMMMDTANILGRSKENNLSEIYTSDIVKKAMQNWKVLEYHQEFKVGELTFRYRDAGHILGSGMVEISYNGKKVMFTGDLGNSPSPLLHDTEIVTDVDYLIMESVYGDRNHEHRDERRQHLEEVIEDNYKNGGVLIIPTFSLERSQELLFEINSLVEHKRVPLMPIFFDSPLAIKLTGVYKWYESYFNKAAQKIISSGDDIFNFPGLTVTKETDESKAIAHSKNPKIIIAGSGMSSGGRIIHHEQNYLPDPNSTLLLIGYQAIGTMGRNIEEGAKTVTINREAVPVKAHVVKISGYSGHKDSDHLVEFVSYMADKVQKVYAVMGEPKSALFLVQRLRDTLAVHASAPARNEKIRLEF